MVVAKLCAICLVLLAVSPVTAPFRSLEMLASSATSRATLSVPGGGDPACIDDATMTTDLVVAKTIRFDAVAQLAAASAVARLPLPGAGVNPVRASGASAASSRITPVLRV